MALFPKAPAESATDKEPVEAPEALSKLLLRFFQASLVVCGMLVVWFVVLSFLHRPVERGPVSLPNPDHVAATVTSDGGWRRSLARTAPERLLIDTIFPDEPVRLAWLQGRTAEAADEGSAVVLDAAGGIVSYSDRLLPRAHGSAASGSALVDVAPAPRGAFWAVTATNELLRIDGEGRVASRESLATFAAVDLVAGPERQLWAVRSAWGSGAEDYHGGTPLAVRVDAQGEGVIPFGTTIASGEGNRRLANAGAIVVTDERVYYAPLTRDEIVAFDLAADTVWVTTRGDLGEDRAFSLVVDGLELPLSYKRFNLGLVLGPDGLLYSLREIRPRLGNDRRIDVYDPNSGDLLRSGTFSSDRSTSIAIDADGRVYLLDEARLVTGLSLSARRPFPSFNLELLTGGSIGTRVLLDRVTVVNVWASWCAPCREEMPLLQSFARSIADSSFQILTFNEDVSPASAAVFLDEMNLDLTVALGRGRLKSQFGYWGLPHTVLVDRRGRVVYSWTGFGRNQQMQQLRAMVRVELER